MYLPYDLVLIMCDYLDRTEDRYNLHMIFDHDYDGMKCERCDQIADQWDVKCDLCQEYGHQRCTLIESEVKEVSGNKRCYYCQSIQAERCTHHFARNNFINFKDMQICENCQLHRCYRCKRYITQLDYNNRCRACTQNMCKKCKHPKYIGMIGFVCLDCLDDLDDSESDYYTCDRCRRHIEKEGDEMVYKCQSCGKRIGANCCTKFCYCQSTEGVCLDCQNYFRFYCESCQAESLAREKPCILDYNDPTCYKCGGYLIYLEDHLTNSSKNK